MVSLTIDKLSGNETTEPLPIINPVDAFGKDECLTLTGNKLGGNWSGTGVPSFALFNNCNALRKQNTHSIFYEQINKIVIFTIKNSSLSNWPSWSRSLSSQI